MTSKVNASSRMCEVLALVCGVCLLASSGQAAVPVFSKAIASLVMQTSGVSLALRAGGLVLADFNSDNQIDAAIPGIYIAGVSVFLSGGGVVTQTWYDAGRSPTALAAGDFDADGDVDLAVALKGENGVAILTNDGTGQFTRTAFHETGLGCIAVAAADLNKDGRMDLVVANRQDGTIIKLTNSAQGLAVRQTLFLPAALPAGQPPVSCQPNALAVADMDGNGWPDVVVACAADDSVRILSNQFGLLVPSRMCAAGPSPVAVAVADLNGDLLPDVAVANRESPQVTVLVQDMAGLFTPQDVFLVSVPYGAFTAPGDVTLVDLDGNGGVDIRCSGYTLYNSGTGQFSSPQLLSATESVYAQGRLAGYPGVFLGTTGTGNVDVSYLHDASYLVGDINADGYVNVGDLQILVANWGKTVGESGCDMRADVNEDGSVNIGDLQALVTNWGAND